MRAVRDRPGLIQRSTVFASTPQLIARSAVVTAACIIAVPSRWFTRHIQR
jgi:hypothetical protein